MYRRWRERERVGGRRAAKGREQDWNPQPGPLMWFRAGKLCSAETCWQVLQEQPWLHWVLVKQQDTSSSLSRALVSSTVKWGGKIKFILLYYSYIRHTCFWILYLLYIFYLFAHGGSGDNSTNFTLTSICVVQFCSKPQINTATILSGL